MSVTRAVEETVETTVAGVYLGGLFVWVVALALLRWGLRIVSGGAEWADAPLRRRLAAGIRRLRAVVGVR